MVQAMWYKLPQQKAVRRTCICKVQQERLQLL